MLQKLYKILTYFLIVVAIIAFTAKIWSLFCTKTATRMYYGSKSQWESIYIIADLELDNVTKDLITAYSYDVLSNPTDVHIFTIEECLINKCTPNLIISNNLDFIKKAGQKYNLKNFDVNVLQYENVISSNNRDEEGIVAIDIWDEKIFFGNVTKNNTEGNFISMLIRQISSDILLRESYNIEAKVAEIKRKQIKQNKRIKQMRSKSENYNLARRGERQNSNLVIQQG